MNYAKGLKIQQVCTVLKTLAIVSAIVLIDSVT